MVCSLDPTVPVIADADTGFGGPAMIARTVTQYARAGVAGLHIEDQVQTKRCGHLLGKQVVSREEFVTRIRAAVIARDSIPGGSDFVIIGRTDSAQVLGMDEANARLKLAADAGADVCFIEGVKSKELLESTVKALAPKPVSFGTQSKIYFVNPPSGPRQCHFWWSHTILYFEGCRRDGCQNHQ
jgi:2-methylisocitrate lyase-like PEP mutase family enzyme